MKKPCKSSKRHMIYISSNNFRHPVTRCTRKQLRL